jgi:DNA-binding beta-propeller fold protein YncE
VTSRDLTSRFAHERARTPRLAVLCAALACVAVLLCLPSAALGARGHQFKEAFGTPCTEVVCEPDTLKEPTAVAVNEATGDVYVLDQASARVGRYSSTGTFLGWFDGSGTFEVEGTPETGPKAGSLGNPGEVETGAFEFPSTANPENIQVSAIAVDNSCALQGLVGPACVDPSNEDVYVLDRSHSVVDKFSPDGEYLGQITEYKNEAEEPFPLNSPEGVAVDAAGSVWVIQNKGGFQGVLEQFANGAGNAFAGTLEVPVGFLSPGLAVDGEGSFYRRTPQSAEVFEAEKLTHSGRIAIGNLNASGLAVDQRLNNSFIDATTFVAAFSPTGSKLEELGEEEGAQHLVAGAGVAVDSRSEDVYVADRSAGRIVVFESQPSKTPEVVSEGATAISSNSASLLAEVNPRSNPGDPPTTYRFQYGPCPGGLASCATSPFPFSTPDAQLGADFEIHPVIVAISDLEPGTAYHYRLSAENSLSTAPTLGEALTFTTQGLAATLLPDHRGYELVTPVDKRGAIVEPIQETGIVQAAPSGDAITYLTNGATEPQPQGVGKGVINVLSARGVDGGWTTQDLGVPNDGPTGAAVGLGYESSFFSEDLSRLFLRPFGAFSPRVSDEASEQTPYLRTTYLGSEPATFCHPAETSCWRPLVTGKDPFRNVPEGTVFGLQGGPCPIPETICGPKFLGASADGAHAVISSTVALTSTPISGAALYEWSADAPPAQQLQLINLLPGSATELAPETGFGYAVSGVAHNERGAISADGSRVFFTSEGGNAFSRRLFLRDTEAGHEETIRLDAGAACPECESGGAVFQYATPDGSRVFFTDEKPLTEGSGAGPSSPDLYECRIVSNGAGALECALTDLTPPALGEAGGVQGFIAGAATDASTLYFVAQGALTPGEGAVHGNCTSISGECNLYSYDTTTRTTHLVAVLSGFDEHDWAQPSGLSARVSPDGAFLAFLSQRSLTGYDNRDAVTGKPVAEMYLYSAAAGKLFCASCNPTGARPRAAQFSGLVRAGGAKGMHSWGGLVAATVPPWVGSASGGEVAFHQPRYLSDSGRVFFNSLDALAPADSNGTADVYEYEPPGVGTCTESDPSFAPTDGGCLNLVSSGSSGEESSFLDASESGDDVFFLTNSRLSAKDQDSAGDVYDARVGGGEPQLVKPVECDGDACQPPATPPVDSTPGSLTFSGAGNVVECPKGKVKKNGRCVKKQQKKAKHKKHHKKGHKNNKKGGGKKQPQGGASKKSKSDSSTQRTQPKHLSRANSKGGGGAK